MHGLGPLADQGPHGVEVGHVRVVDLLRLHSGDGSRDHGRRDKLLHPVSIVRRGDAPSRDGHGHAARKANAARPVSAAPPAFDEAAALEAEKGRIVTLGVKPTFPATAAT